MIKKKLTSILSAIMISMGVLTTNVQIVNAQEVVKISNTVTNLEDGNYTIKNKTSYGSDSSHGEAMARKILMEDSKIVVENGKINITLTIDSSMYPMIEDLKVSLDGQDLAATENSQEKTLTFTVPSLNSKVKLGMNVKGMDHHVEFSISNDTTTLKKLVTTNVSTIKNEVVSDSAIGVQMVKRYLNEVSDVVESDGKYKVTLTFTGSNYMKNHQVSINGNAVEVETETNGDEVKVIFNTDSLQDEIKVSTYIEPMSRDINFGVKLLEDTLVLVNSNTEEVPVKVEGGDVDNSTDTSTPEDTTPDISTPEGTKPEESKPENTNPGNTTTGGESVVTKVYTIENDVIYDNPIGYQMARKYLNNVSKVEETNGKYVVTLTFTGAEYMNSHEVYVNGNKVNATITNNNDEIIVKFEVASLNEDIKVSTYVVPMGRNVEFGVALKNDTLTLVDTIVSDGSNVGNTTGSTTNSGSNNTTTGTGTSTGVATTTNEAPVVVKGKLYSIKNNVTHESETGVAMARKYLESTSYVEEVNGKYYVTLTFTGKEFIQNHVIYVNGKKVNATITNSGDAVKVRFEVSKLSDSIKVKTYVVPMSREVEFGVELLEDTLTFIKEYDVENETLPQTGSPINAETAATLGTILLGAGYALIKRK